jgi:hypothetical protein
VLFEAAGHFERRGVVPDPTGAHGGAVEHDFERGADGGADDADGIDVDWEFPAVCGNPDNCKFRPEDTQNFSALLAEFRKQLARDRTRTTLSGFSALGLVEMTRKRTRESLAHMLCQPCPTCEGRGQVKTARSVCYDILREILREARQFNPREFRVVASAGVVEMLLDEESVHLAGLSEFIGKPISLSAEPGMNPEQYDIVLM